MVSSKAQRSRRLAAIANASSRHGDVEAPDAEDVQPLRLHTTKPATPTTIYARLSAAYDAANAVFQGWPRQFHQSSEISVISVRGRSVMSSRRATGRPT